MQSLNTPLFYGMASLLVDYSNTAWLEETDLTEEEKDATFIFLMNESVYPKIEPEKAHSKLPILHTLTSF